MFNSGSRRPALKVSRVLGRRLALATVTLVLAAPVQAGVYKCVDAKGVSTFSDKPCAPPPPVDAPASVSHAAAVPAQAALTPKESRAREILQLMRLNSGPGADSEAAARIVDSTAPNLLRFLDPQNPNWNPQHPRWHSLLEFVKTDLRRDLTASVSIAQERAFGVEVREYAAAAQIADMDALAKYLNSDEGGRYIAFQNVVRLIQSQSLHELLAAQPIASAPGSAAVIRQRRQVLSLSLEAQLAADDGQSYGPTFEGASAVLDNAVQREGTALDALLAEYGSVLPNFVAFTQTPVARHFFAAVDPAYRAGRAMMDTLASDFSSAEHDKYADRWQAQYGPPLHTSVRIAIGNRYSPTTVTTVTMPNGGTNRTLTAESMAMQCEQRESAAYQARTRNVDPATRALALQQIQNRCRQEQNLGSY